MAEVTIHINGRSYDIACDNGQESRVSDLAAYIDKKLHQVSSAGAAYNDAHLLVLTSLILADELFDTRDNMVVPDMDNQKESDSLSKEDEKDLIDTIQHIADRIDGIATKIDAA